ncbi:MAG: hypothetical protein MK110_15880 [Fuerstiella sp.]|nr:hypothetical protein [Fuerstiella sp.]
MDTEEERKFFDWLREWWYLFSSWIEDPEPVEDDTYKIALLPDTVRGQDVRPIKNLRRAMIAQFHGGWDYITGPSLERDELAKLASEAWTVYQRLHSPGAEQEQQSEMVKTVTGLELPRNEFTEEARRTGAWCQILAPHNGGEPLSTSHWHCRTRGKKGELIRICQTKNQYFIVHLDEIPDNLKKKVQRERYLSANKVS